MRNYLMLVSVCVAVFLSTGCKSQEPPKESEYKLTSPVRQIMGSMVMPNADVLWSSVSTNVTDTGTEEKAPKTEEEWKIVRRSAVTIMEASDLILIPGRRVAAPGEKEQDPNVNLSPEKIEALINADRASWVKMAHDLHDSVLPALKAIDAKDAMALSDAGAGIDKACEDCHLKYWYPKDAGKK
jgi:signal transduction histidine kinase